MKTGTLRIDISVIIPVYNCEKYVLECLDSVCRQTLQSIEIICIDDGSADESYRLIKEYSESDHRVKVVRQENMGAGVARNLGIQLATGKYLAFLDADDYYLEKDALQKLFNACEKNRVRICGSIRKMLQNGGMADDFNLDGIREASQKQTILRYDDFQFDYGYSSFLFQREMLIENQIQFPPYRRFQDPPFLVQAMYAAEQFAFCNTALYCYRVPTMASRFNTEKAEDLLKGLRDNLLFAYEHQLKKLFWTTLMRVEYEYYSVLCHWIDRTDAAAVKLLVEMQEIAGKEMHENYSLRVLQFISQYDKSFFLHYRDNILTDISREQAIYVYGAGGLAKKFLSFLKESGLLHKVRNIIISQKAGEREFLEEVEVKAIDEFADEITLPVYIATGAVFHHEIVKKLQDRNREGYHIVDSIFLEELEV